MRKLDGLTFRDFRLFFIILCSTHPTATNDLLVTDSVARTTRQLAVNSDVGLVQNQAKIITIKGETNISYSYDLTTNCTFVIVQAHTQYRNISLSAKYNAEIYTNSDTAILHFLSHKLNHASAGVTTKDTHSLDYVLQPAFTGSSLQSLVAATTYMRESPIPGGCCLTCSLEVDPNLVITTPRYYKTTLTFSLANVYDYKTSLCSGSSHEKPRHFRLQYSVYQYFLEEGNLHDDELFHGLTNMLTPSSVKKHGKKVRDWNPKKDFPSFTFDTKRGQGIVFNILVYDPVTNMDAVYSPAATYGCSFTAKVDGCDSLGSIVNIVIAVCGSVLGLFICFFGHRFYQLYLAVGGLTLFSFAGFILLTNVTEWSHTVRMIVSVCIGLIGSALLYLFWWWSDYRRVVLYICGLTLGFLVAAVLFFTPFGDLKYWKNDVNYWTVFLCTTVTIPCVFLLFLKAFVILVASLVGAYGFVVGIDTFIHSSLSYIVLDVIMKATVDDFQKYDIPFQTKDYILVVTWVVLTLIGLAVQLIMSMGQETLRAAPKKNKGTTRNIQGNQTSSPEVPSRNTHDTGLPTLVNSRRADNSEPENQFADDERLPILVESRPVLSRLSNTNDEERKTKYGTNIVC